jgi:DNA-binding SARP family transcriptional activator/pimeloyl-ACP methyl ester carboxylesterase
LLGGFAVVQDGRVLVGPRWPRSKARALIKLLALQPGHTLHRERVIDLLWPASDRETAANQLHKSVHYVRRAVSAAFIRIEGPLLRLGGDTVDVDEFRAAAVRALSNGAGRDAFESALAIYAGELLPEDLYEPWTEAPREELRRLHERLLLRYADALEVDGARDDAVAALERVLASDRAHEEAHRGLMRIFHLAGARDRALRQYELCRRALRDDLDAEPSAETGAVFAAIRDAGSLAGAHPQESTLPPLDIRHVRSFDGTRIAYTTHGSGDPLVFTPGWPWGHLQVEWEIPPWRHLIESLARHRTVVRYDPRGSGLSQRDVADLSVDAQVADLAAVVDEIGCERFDVVVLQNCGPCVITYAARQPQRIGRLVFWSTWANGAAFAEAMLEPGLRQLMEKNWELYRDSIARAATGFRDEELAKQIATWFDASVSRATFERDWEVAAGANVTPLLAAVVAPSLVLAPTSALPTVIDLPRRLAGGLPHASFRQLPRDEVHPVAGDVDALVAEIVGFLDAPDDKLCGLLDPPLLPSTADAPNTAHVRQQHVRQLD